MLPIAFDGEEQWRCPLRGWLEDPVGLNEVFQSYFFYREGHFPEPGTWQDQSARLLSFFQTITLAHQAADEIERERAERQRLKTKR